MNNLRLASPVDRTGFCVDEALIRQKQSHELLETTIGDPAEKPEDYGCSASRIGESVLDGFEVTANVFHVPSDALEACFQFSDARFHINFSVGFHAVLISAGWLACFSASGATGNTDRLDSINPIATTRRKADLADVLGPLLQAAGDQAGASRRSDAYRDALLVTALRLSGHNIALVIPGPPAGPGRFRWRSACGSAATSPSTSPFRPPSPPGAVNRWPTWSASTRNRNFILSFSFQLLFLRPHAKKAVNNISVVAYFIGIILI